MYSGRFISSRLDSYRAEQESFQFRDEDAPWQQGDDCALGLENPEPSGRVPMACPERNKVSLPRSSLRQELLEAFEPILALFRISRRSMRRFNGKPWRTKAYVLAAYCFPIIDWVRTYKASYLAGDLLAGLTVWSVFPEDLGYASLAKLPPSFGLHNNFLPPVAYAILGTSQQLCVGTSPLLALLIASLCSKRFDPVKQTQDYIIFVTTVTFFSGCLTAVLGIFRFGFLADLLSHAAILGFLAGVSVISILQEIGSILGYTTPPNVYDIISIFQYLIQTGSEFRWQALVLGLSVFLFLYTLGYLALRFQHAQRAGRVLHYVSTLAPFTSIVVTSLAVYLTGAYGPDDNPVIPTVVEIKRDWDFMDGAREIFTSSKNLLDAFGVAVIVGLMSILESVAIAKLFGAIKGRQIHPNKEMVAIGAVNIVASLTSGFSMTGSFARSGLAFSAGANTQLFSLVLSVGVLLVITLLFQVATFIPTACLSAIIINALLLQIRIPSMIHLWHTDKLDFLVFLGTFLGIIFLNLQFGFLLALGMSALTLMIPVSRPRVLVLGEVPGTGMFRPITEHHLAREETGVLACTVSGSIVFSNAGYVRESILGMVDDRNDCADTAVKLLLLDMTPVADIDTTGIHALFELLKHLRHLQFAISNPSKPVLRKLVSSGFLSALGTDKLFFSAHEAVQTFKFIEQLNAAHAESNTGGDVANGTKSDDSN